MFTPDSEKILNTNHVEGRELEHNSMIEGLLSTNLPLMIFRLNDCSGTITCLLNSTQKYLYEKMNQMVVTSSNSEFYSKMFNVVGYLTLDPFGGYAIQVFSINEEKESINADIHHCLSIITDNHYLREIKLANELFKKESSPFAESFNRSDANVSNATNVYVSKPNNISNAMEVVYDTQSNNNQEIEMEISDTTIPPHNVTPYLTPSENNNFSFINEAI
jgi:hypothetical protein